MGIKNDFLIVLMLEKSLTIMIYSYIIKFLLKFIKKNCDKIVICLNNKNEMWEIDKNVKWENDQI